MKIHYIRNNTKICSNIVEIYRMVLKYGYKIRPMPSSNNPELQDIVNVKLFKDLGPTTQLMLHPSKRTVTRTVTRTKHGRGSN